MDVKGEVQLNTLGAKLKGDRTTRNEDVLIQVGGDAEDKNEMSSGIREAVGVGGNVYQLGPRIEDELLSLGQTNLEKEIRDAVRRHFGASLGGDVEDRMTKKAYRGT